MKGKWYSIEEKMPKPGDYILAQIERCNVCGYIKMTVREGEGLGHIRKWTRLLEEPPHE